MQQKDKSKLPRYRRQSANKPPLILQDRDTRIIQAVYENRFMTSELIKILFPGSERGVLSRLQKLFHHGFLDRIKGPVSMPIVYALGDQGAELLKELGILETRGTGWRKKNRKIKELYLDHTLQIARFRTILTLALKNKPQNEILSWVPEREITKYEVMIQDGTYREIRAPVIPDGFFALTDKGQKMYFFLEADRSTMTQERFLRKMKAYWQFWKQGKHVQRFNIQSFRVLTITKSQERMMNLRELTRMADDHKKGSLMFWFTSETLYDIKSPDAVLGSIWQTPRDNSWHHILE